MNKKVIERKGGWQCWVEIYKNHVIKTPKSRKEVEKEVRKFLIWKNKIGELKQRTDKMISDIKNSIKIIKKSKIPRKLLADLKFLKDGKIKQKRVIALSIQIKKLNLEEKKKLINKIIKFWIKLWTYGIQEKTFKFFSNLGWDGKKVVLIDIFEITSIKKKALKQIKGKKWNKPERFKKYLSKKLIDYFIQELDKNLTEKNLNKYWKKAE